MYIITDSAEKAMKRAEEIINPDENYLMAETDNYYKSVEYKEL